MKREDLKKLGLADDVIDQIMTLHGQDLEKHKSDTTTAQAEVENLRKQLTEATTAIEGFKKLNPEALQAEVEEWKKKAEEAQQAGQQQVAQLRFDHALDRALADAKARNPRAVRALLNTDALKFNEADGSIVGLTEQLEKVKTENGYMFESATPDPQIVAGGQNSGGPSDAFLAAVRKGAGLPEGK